MQSRARVASSGGPALPGFRAVSDRERLEWLATQPMRPRSLRPQKPMNVGLFDEDARNQLDLVDLLRRTTR